MRRTYIREAVVMLILARFAVRFLPPDFVLTWTARPPRRIRRFSEYEIDWVSWAVETAGAKHWIRAACLPRAVAAQTMLRRRGITSQLCLGVARNGATLDTLAWVEIGPNIVVGEAERYRSTRVGEFG
jgi:hypothetical protein